MVAILKQGQYTPQPVERQVAIIYAANAGALDKIPVERLADYEKGYYDFIESRYAKVFELLRTKKAIDDEVKPMLDKAIGEYGGQFA